MNPLHEADARYWCLRLGSTSTLIEALADLRTATPMAGSPLAATVLHTVLTDGSYRRHIEGVCARVVPRLRAFGVDPWIEPAAGIFLWARFPDGADAVDLARRALEDGIVLASGP